MAGKYQQLDRKLFAWLRANRTHATTAAAGHAIGAKSSTHQRHVSRRFTQLEDKGVLKCTLQGTTRICEVVAEIPVTLSKQPWRSQTTREINQVMGREAPTIDHPSIPAANSDEFLAAGGTIETIPTNWDRPMIGSQPLGPSYFDDFD